MTNLLLMSGGLDSAALAAWKRPTLLTVNYGQVASEGELRSASAIARSLGLHHYAIDVDARKVGAGDLAAAEPADDSRSSEWWPFRNQLLVTIAASWLILHPIADTILIGAVCEDARFADGTEGFLERLDDLLHYQEENLHLAAPAVHMTSAELVTISGLTESIASLAHSCDTASMACGHCRGCTKRNDVYRTLGWRL